MHDADRDLSTRQGHPGLAQHVHHGSADLAPVGGMAQRQRLRSNHLKVNVGPEDPARVAHVVEVDDELAEALLRGLQLAGQLRALALQAGDDVLVFHQIR